MAVFREYIDNFTLPRGDITSTLCFELCGPHEEATVTLGIFYTFIMYPRAWAGFVSPTPCPHRAWHRRV